jgi:hypothetical protein
MKRLYPASVSVEATGGPVPLEARFADYRHIIDNHIVHVIAADDEEACDIAIAEVFQSYNNECNLVDYECGEGLLAN